MLVISTMRRVALVDVNKVSSIKLESSKYYSLKWAVGVDQNSESRLIGTYH